MKKDNMISVIIPFYNSEKWLEKSVKSIANQTYKNLEIILVNDGSDDGSVGIAKRLAGEDDRIVFISLPHGGVSVARNKGIEHANGRYILFADSDDTMNARIIKRMMKVMKKTDADIVSCEVERTTTDRTDFYPQRIYYKILSQDEYMRRFFKINSNKTYHYPVAKIYKKELLPTTLFPEGIRVGEDVIGTYIALCNAKNVAVLNDVGYYYNINPKSATGEFTDKDFDLLEVWDRMEELTKGRKPDHAYAKLNRKRTDFTLLLRMLTRIYPEEMEEKYPGLRERLLRDLKSNEKELLLSPIVPSRKLMILLLCHAYLPTSVFAEFLVCLRKNLPCKI